MPTLQDPLLIVTDLDGSLLDHHTYSWQDAEPWLTKLTARLIPIVLCTSKTAAEIVPLQNALDLSGSPFIAENGAVLRWQNAPDSARLPPHPTVDYASLCATLQQLKQQYQLRFTGFSEVSEKEVADWTGLTPRDAALARQREASESIIWRDSDEQFARFRTLLAERQLSLVQGGRFWSVLPAGCDKGSALRQLLASYPARPVTLGLGDGPNDAAMLDAVDYAVIIKGFSRQPVILQRSDSEHIYHTNKPGPQGWCEGLEHFISQ